MKQGSSKTPRTTTLHEIYVSFVGTEKSLVCNVEAEGVDRLVRVLESDLPCSFYSFDLVDEGYDCFVNLSQIEKVSVLNVLAGLPMTRREPDRTDLENEKRAEEREESDDPVVLRIWVVGKTDPELYLTVEYNEWNSIQMSLEQNDQKFIGFLDDDGERVMFPLARIAAIEAFDTHYVSDADLDRVLDGTDKSLSPGT
jgi:hypothetical protein